MPSDLSPWQYYIVFALRVGNYHHSGSRLQIHFFFALKIYRFTQIFTLTYENLYFGPLFVHYHKMSSNLFDLDIIDAGIMTNLSLS